MRVLCCLDGTNAGAMARAVAMLSAGSRTLGLLHALDLGPRRSMELMKERFMRSVLPHQQEILATERAAIRDILDEGLRQLPGAEAFTREGRPEREIVNLAAQWQADLVLICNRTLQIGAETLGPGSVGHVARFVVDHAPCPVLLLRPPAGAHFPMES